MELYYQFFKKNIYLVIISLGIILRLRAYLFNHPLDIDEAHWASIIKSVSIQDFFSVLNGNQIAPPFFLIIQKLFLNLFGNSEYVLRLFPLILGLISLPLFFKLASKFLSKPFALMALLLFVLSDYLILYSTVDKRYAADVFWAILINLIVLKIIEKKWQIKMLIILMILGMLSPWFSYTSVLILIGVGVVLLISALSYKKKVYLINFLAVFIYWSISLGLFYLLHLRMLSDSQDYHREYFDTRGVFAPAPFSPSALQWYIKNILAYFQEPVGLNWLFLGPILFILGCIYSFIKSKTKFIQLSAPLFLALVISHFKFYPFLERYLLFTLPTTLILIVMGLEFIYSRLGFMIVIPATLLFITPVAISYEHFYTPFIAEDIRPILKYIKSHKKNGDTIYIYYAAQPTFYYYASNYKLDKLKVVEGFDWRDNREGYTDELNNLMGLKRVWILFSHLYMDEEQFFLNYLRSKNELLLDSNKSLDSSVYLFDLSQ